MNSLSLSSFLLISPPKRNLQPFLHSKLQPSLHTLSPISLTSKRAFLRATDSNTDAPVSISGEGTPSFVPIAEIIEKDWSVLDCGHPGPDLNRSVQWIISAGNVEESSRVLVSTASEEFVDCLVASAPCKSLFVVHDSLLTLACVKEKYDKVKCWQGEILHVPEKWAPFDAVFLYFLPALPFKFDDVLASLAKYCSPGGRVIISHPKGREVLEQQRQKHPDVVVSDLPDETYLRRVAAACSFDVVEFVDEPGFYLAVLICSRA